MCIGGSEDDTKHNPPLSLAYQSTIFHRIVKNGWIQGGGKLCALEFPRLLLSLISKYMTENLIMLEKISISAQDYAFVVQYLIFVIVLSFRHYSW